jgi:hypothetical protein
MASPSGFPTEWFATIETSELENMTCAICVCVARMPVCHRQSKPNDDEAALQALARLVLVDGNEAKTSVASDPTPAVVAPRAQPACQALFCAACIQQWHSKSTTCPACRVVVPEHEWIVHIQAIQSISKGLQVNCPFREDGCAWKSMRLMPARKKNTWGSQTHVDQHMRDECTYAPRACPHGKCTFFGTNRESHVCYWKLASEEDHKQMLHDLASNTPLSLDSMVRALLPASRVNIFSYDDGHVEGHLSDPRVVVHGPEFYLQDLTVTTFRSSLDYQWRDAWFLKVKNAQHPCQPDTISTWQRLVTCMCECVAHEPRKYFPNANIDKLLQAPLHERIELVRSLHYAGNTLIPYINKDQGVVVKFDLSRKAIDVFRGANNDLIEGSFHAWSRVIVPGASISVACKLPIIVAVERPALRWWISANVSQVHVSS